MMKQFLIPHVVMLAENGFEVEVACSDIGGRLYEIRENLRGHVKKFYTIRLVRSPFTIKNIYGYRDLKGIIKDGNYDLIWTNEPVMGISTRLAAVKARKAGTKVIYMAHGFHFFKGAPLINWLLYYPVEKLSSRWTDVLITINTEDYERAKKKFHAKKVEYIPGVGLDTKKFRNCIVNKGKKCEDLGIPSDQFIMLSIGELHDRKNQRVVIEALHKLDNHGIYYLIVGEGRNRREYKKLIEEYSLESNIKLLGYRNDIDELCQIADCFVHPSVREGLGIAPLEAMASGLPLIASDVNGIKDYAKDGVTGCCINPLSVDEMCSAIVKMLNNGNFRKECGSNNIEVVKRFDILNSCAIMQDILQTGGNSGNF